MEADVGFEQRLLDELEPVAHVRFGEFALAAQGAECAGEALLDGFEHGGSAGNAMKEPICLVRATDFTARVPAVATLLRGRFALGILLAV